MAALLQAAEAGGGLGNALDEPDHREAHTQDVRQEQRQKVHEHLARDIPQEARQRESPNVARYTARYAGRHPGKRSVLARDQKNPDIESIPHEVVHYQPTDLERF